MKTIHYTNGYGGRFNYTTACGAEIHSHSETEDATIDPQQVTCQECMKSKDWVADYEAKMITEPGIKRRIYIESDILHASELRDAQRIVADLCKKQNAKCVKRVFSEVLEYAWHDLEKTWEAVKKADEIYTISSLLPLSGGSYIGAPVIFNGMCERAIKENVTGKDVYIFTTLSDVNWYMIKLDLMRKAFRENNLFMYDDDYNVSKVDVSNIKK